MNRFIAIGNVVRDPETKVTQSGKKFTRFTVAINRNYKNQNGEREADFVQFTAYDKTAEAAEKYLAKGRKVGVESRVRTGSYEKDGRTIYTTEFIVENLEFLTPAHQETTEHEQKPAQQTNNQSRTVTEAFSQVTVDDDELPF